MSKKKFTNLNSKCMKMRKGDSEKNFKFQKKKKPYICKNSNE